MEPQKNFNENNDQDSPADQSTAGQTFSPSAATPVTSPTAASSSPTGPTPQVIASTAPTLPNNSSATASSVAPTPFSSSAATQAAPTRLTVQPQSNTVNPASPINGSPSGFSAGVPPVGTPVASAKPSKKRRRVLFIAALVVLIAVLSGGYAFAFVLPNSPDNIFKHGLSNTSLAYDKLTDYASTVSKQKYKGAKIEGTMMVDVGGVSGDGTFSFQNNGANGTGKLAVDLSGEKLDANIRSVAAAGQKEPDVYFQVNGIKTVLDKYGLTTLDSLDGKWISVDHTLIKSATNSATQGNDATMTVPTPAQVEDALAKVGKVNNQYVFKADTGHAVLEQKKYLGKSAFEGRSVYGYEVGYDKAHLKSYIDALSSALDSSSLNDWSKTANDGKSLSATLQFSSLTADVAKAKEDYTFKMYVDAQTKLIANVHFTGDKATDTFDIGQTYKGGDVYPFVFKIASNETDSGKAALALHVSLNSKTNEVTVGATFDGTSGGSATKLSLNAKLTPTNDTINVTAPTGATPINNVIAQLGLGGSSSASSDSSSALDSSLGSNLFTLTQ